MTEEKPKTEVKDLIQSLIKETLEKMSFIAEVETRTDMVNETETLIFNIKTSDSNFLIGQYGVNLQSLQHIIRLLVRKKVDEKINFLIDVNNYRQEKNSSVEKLARETAEECLRENREVLLRPMAPYERRIVHLELAKNKEVTTESIGEGENRRVLIRPASQLKQ
jgi:spoIIIJ-associated protein